MSRIFPSEMSAPTTGKARIVVLFSIFLFMVGACGADSGKSKDYKALTRSRNDVIVAARRIRYDSRQHAQPSVNFFGNFYRCPNVDKVHYSLETDWIAPKGDADDLRSLRYIVEVLKSHGWASSVTSQREETMRTSSLEIRISASPGAEWITGIIGGPCYNAGEKSVPLLDRAADQLSG